MGGSRFAADGGSIRLDRGQHARLSAETIELLRLQGVDATPLRVMSGKESFGDVDLLAPRSQTHDGLPTEPDARAAMLAERDAGTARALGAIRFGRTAAVDPTLSLLVPTDAGPAQIDITSVEDRHLAFTEAHLAWGDASSLAAVVARQMSIKMGMHGARLAMRLPRGGEVEAALPLTHAETLELAGFDAGAHERGFATNEEAFAWIADGAYFNPVLWTHAWRTSKARARGMKRPVYLQWTAWLERVAPPARYDWGEARGARADEWLDRMRRRFPEASRELDRQAAVVADRRDGPVRTFFTGRRVSEATGVEGEPLMHLMNAIRGEIGGDGLARMEREGDVDGLLSVARRLAGVDA